MVVNPNKESISKQSKRVIIGLVLIALIIYFITNYQNKQLRSEVRKSEFSGIVTSYKYMGGRNGYYYYTDKNDCIMAFYFFEEDIPQNLNSADSIYKAPDSFRLYIYKKDESGKYVFDRLAQIHNDSY